MSHAGLTQPVPEQLGKPLEDSLTTLVNSSGRPKGGEKDQLARELLFYL